MKTYKIKSGYKGCGEAFAEIGGTTDTKVVKLWYINDIVDYDDWAAVSDEEQPYLEASGEVKVQNFAEQHPNLIRGMASAGEFVVR